MSEEEIQRESGNGHDKGIEIPEITEEPEKREPLHVEFALGGKALEFMESFLKLVDRMGKLDGDKFYFIFHPEYLGMYALDVTKVTATLFKIDANKLIQYIVKGDNGAHNVVAGDQEVYPRVLKLMFKGSGEKRMDFIVGDEKGMVTIKKGRRKAQLNTSSLNYGVGSDAESRGRSIVMQFGTFLGSERRLKLPLKLRVNSAQFEEGVEGAEAVQVNPDKKSKFDSSFVIIKYAGQILDLQGHGMAGLFGNIVDHTLLEMADSIKGQEVKVSTHIEYMSEIGKNFPQENIDLSIGSGLPVLFENSDDGLWLLHLIAPRREESNGNGSR